MNCMIFMKEKKSSALSKFAIFEGKGKGLDEKEKERKWMMKKANNL